MQTTPAKFIPAKGGDHIRADAVVLTSADVHSPAVPDTAVIAAVLTTGFNYQVRVGDLRRALGIVVEVAK